MHPFREYAHEHMDEIIQELTELCALPSIADQEDALQATAEHVAGLLEACGLKARLISAGGPPVVYAEKRVRGKPTVLFYNHYDVQPAGDESEWRFPPFEPRTYYRRFYARGAVDNKGNIIARLWALRAWQELHGELPVGVRFVIEGEEEVGSPHLPDFVEANEKLLQGDGCIWEAGDISAKRRPQLYLGMKGVLCIEMEAQGAANELHSSWATIAPNPIWRLAWLLGRLKGSNEDILIDGFYDDVLGPTREEIDTARELPFPEKELLEIWQIDGFLQGLSGNTIPLCQFYSPTCNVSGIEGGHGGDGIRTIVPASARARLDFRLVPNQRPERILELVREYVKIEGFGDVTVRPLGPALPPSSTSAEAPFVQAVIEATDTAYGRRPVVYPTAGGSGPMYLFSDQLGMPVVSLGVGHPNDNTHGPNENVRLSDLEKGIAHIGAILERLSAGVSK